MRHVPFSDQDVKALTSRLEQAARALVAEPGQARDLAQEAWLSALQQGVESLRHPLQWMKVVMRRRSMRLHAQELLRKHSESVAARPEAVNDDVVLERASMAALLLSELDQLEEVYRDVLRQRFLDELSVREIAESAGSTPATVRSQLARGLARLRERLDRRAGSRGTWAGALLGAAGLEPRLPIDGAQGLELAARTRSFSLAGLGAAALVASLGVTIWIATTGNQSETQSAPVRTAGLERPGPIEVQEPAGGQRTSQESGPVAEQPQDEPESEPALEQQPVPSGIARLRIEVKDAFGMPAQGVFGDFLGRDRKQLFTGEMGPDASLVLDVPEQDLVVEEGGFDGCLVVSMRTPESAWSDTFAVLIEPGSERILRVTLDQASCGIHLRAIDEEGSPIVGVRVDISAQPAEVRVVDEGLIAVPKMIEAATDANGRVRFEGLPPKPHVVRISADGFLAADWILMPSPEDDVGEVVLTMARSAVLEGQVTYADGEPATNATVVVAKGFDRRSIAPRARTDEYGVYRLHGIVPGVDTRVFAFDQDDRSLNETTVVRIPKGEVGSFDAVLERSPGLQVRVFRADGSPASGAEVLISAEREVSGWYDHAPVAQDGKIWFKLVPAEPLQVRVYPGLVRGGGDVAAARRNVRASREVLELKLSESYAQDGELSGRVRMSASGSMAGLEAIAMLEEFAESRRMASVALLQAQVNEHGEFSFAGMEAGNYRLHLMVDQPELLGSLDLGLHTVLQGQRTIVPDVALPEPHGLRILSTASSGTQPLVISTNVGPYSAAFLVRQLGASLELLVLPGSYLLARERGAPPRSVRVDADVEVDLRR